MYKTTKKWTWTRAGLDLILASLGAATPTFTTAGLKVAFSQNNVVLDGSDTAIAAFTICDFTGYSTITLGAIGAGTPSVSGPLNVDADTLALGASIMERATADPTASQNITAVYLMSAAGDALYGFEKFTDPAPITQAADFLQYDLVLPLPLVVNLAA